MNVSQMRMAMLSVHSCPLGSLGTKDTGGMSVYVRELARELGEQGMVVDVYTRVHDPNDDMIYRLGKNARLIHLKAGKDEEIEKLAVYSFLPGFTASLDDFRRSEGIKYDMVFSHYWLSGWVGRLLQQRWNVPHFMMFHTVGTIKNAVGIGESEPALRLETEKQLAEDCHRIITATEREKAELIRLLGVNTDKIAVIPCGVNLELFRPVERDTARRFLGLGKGELVLSVGRIEPLKGIDQLIRAIACLKNGQQPGLMIIGGGDDSLDHMEELRRLSRTLGVKKSVDFRGLIRQEKLPLFYSAADVCVIPSYYETFGLVALESLACGTPIVATRVGGFADVIRHGETGYVLPDNNPLELADRISRLLYRADGNTRNALAIRDSVNRYSWANIAESIIKQCQEARERYLVSTV